MKRLVEFPMENGQRVLVEIDDAGRGPLPAGRVDKIIERADKTFDSMLRKIGPLVESLIGVLTHTAAKPSKVEMKFSIKLSAGADVILASTALEGQIEVSLSWEKQQID